MRPTQILRSGGGDAPIGKYGHYLGTWGAFGSPTQRGIIYYGVSPNRQNPFAHAGHDAVFNTWRRFSKQVLYWLPPIVAGYYAMKWAIETNEHVNSKAGHAEGLSA